MTREEYQKECLESFIREEYDSMVWEDNLFTDHVRKMFNAGIQCADTMPKPGLVDFSQVWHPANEMPQVERQVLGIDYDGEAGSGVFEYKSVAGIFINDDLILDWDSVVKWAYIDDLLTKGGEK